jgi:hypothetical protein
MNENWKPVVGVQGMKREGLFLKVDNFNGFDTWYARLKVDKTWREVLDQIELVLDEKYLLNEDRLEGIKVSFEIVNLTREQYNQIDWLDDDDYLD